MTRLQAKVLGAFALALAGLSAAPAQAAALLGDYNVTHCCGSSDGTAVDAAANGLSYAGNISLGNLSAYSVIVAGSYNASFTNWIADGGALIWHDWNPFGGAVLPGMSALTGAYAPGSNVNVLASGSPIVNGPFGTLTNTNMDGGSSSVHGYVNLASLHSSNPLVSDITAILSDGNSSHVSEFSYRYGKGLVIYAAMPTDAYTGSSPFNTSGTAGLSMLGKNEVAYASTFSKAAGNNVPEPSSMALAAISLLALGALRRRAR